MQLFVLIMVNIAMFAIFYLFISLKLERKATEFRERKMRRIMEEMINEFNETAERNISILENRISTLRRLLKISGEVSSLDVRIADDAAPKLPEKKIDQREIQSKIFSDTARDRMMESSSEKPSTGELLRVLIHDGVDAIAKTFRHLRSRTQQVSSHTEDEQQEKNSKYAQDHARHHRSNDTPKTDGIVSNDSIIPKASENEKRAGADLAVDEDIIELFRGAKDKYALVSDLYARGYSVESISRCSGIPQGEIRLVLNLGI